MTCLDRYVLRLLAGPFVFFVLVFTGVIWLSQSLRVIDTVVNNGQSAAVFLEFTALLLPTVLSVVLPVAAFAATLYAINRLFSDSEVVAMFAAGISGFALLRPIALFGGVVMVGLFANTLYLMPTAKRVMQERISEVRGDVAAAFLREGAFASPVKGLNVYLREMGRPGEMLGVFVHDERDPDQTLTYTAERAVLVPREADGGVPQLLMFDGLIQTVTQPETEGDEAALSVLRFERLAYDLSELGGREGPRRQKPSEFYLPQLLGAAEGETGYYSLGDFRAEAHEALSAPLYVLALPLMGAALLIGAGFRRQGFLERIALAAVAGLGLRLAGLAAKSVTVTEAALWPLLYLPPLLGMALALWLLSTLGGRSA
ncbi:MAG: LPS export ABC transporter permease LptF [Pseudomonadota bacterium]